MLCIARPLVFVASMKYDDGEVDGWCGAGRVQRFAETGRGTRVPDKSAVLDRCSA